MTLKDKLKDIGAVIMLWLMIALDDIKEIITTVVVTLLVVLLCNSFFFRIVSVDGTSMQPTVMSGSYGFSNIVARKLGGIDRFDIVVINSESRGKNLIKRVVGLPGETISYKEGKLYVDGKVYSEDFLDPAYVASQTPPGRYFTGDFTVSLGENEYFCLGDNRLVSADSRVYGSFSNEEIVAKDIFVVFPFKYFGKR